jgi:glycosyltransferase involved in cell wall biosynthesis
LAVNSSPRSSETSQTRTEGASLTVLMPVREYDAGYLHQAVDSLRSQTDPRWRLLVLVEEADRRRIANELAAELADERIELAVNEGRKLAGAFNTGLRRARTDFAAILFGDDLWTPNAVEVLAELIRSNPDVDFFHSSRRIIDDDGRPISSVYRPPGTVRPQDFAEKSPVKHLLCWRVELALSIGGMDETLNSVGPDDWDFPWSMSEAGATFMAVDECLYLYRDHRRCYRLTTHLPTSVHASEIRRIMRKHGADRGTIRRRVAAARATYLRQCLYDSRLEQWARRVTGAGPGNLWRETYR